jgi:hypothetical protein
MPQSEADCALPNAQRSSANSTCRLRWLLRGVAGLNIVGHGRVNRKILPGSILARINRTNRTTRSTRTNYSYNMIEMIEDCEKP